MVSVQLGKTGYCFSPKNARLFAKSASIRAISAIRTIKTSSFTRKTFKNTDSSLPTERVLNMKQLVFLNGKGSTGNTSLAAAFAHLVHNGPYALKAVLADADVDAANLELVLRSERIEVHDFTGGSVAVIDQQLCQSSTRVMGRRGASHDRPCRTAQHGQVNCLTANSEEERIARDFILFY
jgi:hypothetical protein